MKLKLKDYPGVKIHKTALRLTKFLKTKLEPYNLAPEQNLIMMLLWEQEGIAQHELVEILDKDKTNITRMASNLESKGFIKRETNMDGRRAVKLYLTEEGRALGAKVIPIAEEFNSIVTKGITNEEILQLERILSKIDMNLQID
ncbi:MarR family winged helix-turn-helix transcriptional regulator [Niallia taxi]|uniref:MarR family winged helix-turn-helix transcriptional regulator n=1 Tax=Niallia taxi TaxID=2499688 RepID=UPI0015F374C3|nr:MarR family transcriptional regulator [Niallia taxi]